MKTISHSVDRTRWWTPGRAISFVVGVLLLSVTIGIVLALLPPMSSFSERRENRMDVEGWLPAVDDVTAVRAHVLRPSDEGDDAWVTVQLPLESAKDILASLSRREKWVPRQKPGMLVNYDFESGILVELSVVSRRRPVQIGLMHWAGASIGDRVFRLPPDDARLLKGLVNSQVDEVLDLELSVGNNSE